MESFTTCERRHYYAYGVAGGLRKRKESDALTRGIIGHAALATYYSFLKQGYDYQNRVEQVNAFLMDLLGEAAEQDFLGNQATMAMIGEVRNLLTFYFQHYRERDENMEVLEVEKVYEVPVGDNFFMKIIVDMIVRMPNIGIAVWDHKFVYDFYNPSIVDLNPQLPKYLAVVNAAGIPCDNAFYNEIRYRVTKANQNNPTECFEFARVPISPARIRITMEEQLRTASKIKYLRGLGLEEWEKRILRAANSMICGRCPFTELCELDLNNRDKTLAIEWNYTPKKRDINA